jgi:hypothetical protein
MMDSILQDSIIKPVRDRSHKGNETQAYSAAKYINLCLLISFGVVFVLTFIWCGLPGAFPALQAYSALYGVFNALFVIASHEKKVSPFKWPYLPLALYISLAVSLLLSLTFMVLGCIHISQHEPNLPHTPPELEKKYLIARYMLAFTIIFTGLSVSFTLYGLKFRQIHVDTEERGSSSAKNGNIEDEEEEDNKDNAHRY